jgi:predicted membrane channel-forming protein YqfA (hemolysin III family)
MQKPKPIEYLQAILYHIKYKWRAIVMAVLVTATGILALAHAATNISLLYELTVITGLATLITAVVIYAPEISRELDKLGLNITPEDEES